MEKFLEKFQTDIENKMLSCVRGESIVKPFDQIYDYVREKKKKVINQSNKKDTHPYYEDENSIYNSVIQSFLKEHPELLED